MAWIMSFKYNSTLPINFKGLEKTTDSEPTEEIISFAKGLSPSYIFSKVSLSIAWKIFDMCLLTCNL